MCMCVAMRTTHTVLLSIDMASLLFLSLQLITEAPLLLNEHFDLQVNTKASLAFHR